MINFNRRIIPAIVIVADKWVTPPYARQWRGPESRPRCLPLPRAAHSSILLSSLQKLILKKKKKKFKLKNKIKFKKYTRKNNSSCNIYFNIIILYAIPCTNNFTIMYFWLLLQFERMLLRGKGSGSCSAAEREGSTVPSCISSGMRHTTASTVDVLPAATRGDPKDGEFYPGCDC